MDPNTHLRERILDHLCNAVEDFHCLDHQDPELTEAITQVARFLRVLRPDWMEQFDAYTS
jgi:hypothetical protein